jgi:hypothetical protein
VIVPHTGASRTDLDLGLLGSRPQKAPSMFLSVTVVPHPIGSHEAFRRDQSSFLMQLTLGFDLLASLQV